MTKYEQARIEAMMKLGCCFCAVLGIVYVACDRHHIVEGNRRMGEWFTLPVCPGHHRGAWTPEQKLLFSCWKPHPDEPALDALVGIFSGSKAFEPIYGTEREMWVKLQHRLKLPAVWRPSKILPRLVTVH